MKNFDKIIADKLHAADQYAPNPSMWKRIENELSATAPAMPSSSGKAGFISGLAASVLLGVLLTQLPSLSTMESKRLQSVQAVPAVADRSASASTSTAPIFEAQQRHEISLVERVNELPATAGEETQKTTEKSVEKRADQPEATNDHTQKELAVAPSVAKGESVAYEQPTSPELNFKAIGIQCVGEEVVFEYKGSFDKVEWLFDGVAFVNAEVARHTFQEPGSHQVMLIAYDNGQRYTNTKEIEVYPSPSAQIVANVTNDQECFKASTKLTAEPGSNAYKWNVNGVERTGNNAQLFLENGRYNARLTAINQHGCVSEHVRTIEVTSARDLFIPSAFSPDNDGVNDVWFPEGLDRVERFEVNVYELTTKRLVYRTTEMLPWNGRINGTAEQAERGDKFIYEVIATDECGHSIKRDGMITAF